MQHAHATSTSILRSLKLLPIIPQLGRVIISSIIDVLNAIKSAQRNTDCKDKRAKANQIDAYKPYLELFQWLFEF